MKTTFNGGRSKNCGSLFSPRGRQLPLAFTSEIFDLRMRPCRYGPTLSSLPLFRRSTLLGSEPALKLFQRSALRGAAGLTITSSVGGSGRLPQIKSARLSSVFALARLILSRLAAQRCSATLDS